MMSLIEELAHGVGAQADAMIALIDGRSLTVAESDAMTAMFESLEPLSDVPVDANLRWSYIPTNNKYPDGSSHVEPIAGIAVHYTASPRGKGPMGSDVPRMERWANDDSRTNSTHFIVMRDGLVLNMVDMDSRAWHITSDRVRDGRGSINNWTIGVDFENVGYLSAQADGTLRDAYGGRFTGDVYWDLSGNPWEAYTEEQHVAGAILFAMLHDKFGPGLDVFGHEDVQTTRSDPGPALDWSITNE